MCTERGREGKEGNIRSGKTYQVFGRLTKICQPQKPEKVCLGAQRAC